MQSFPTQLLQSAKFSYAIFTTARNLLAAFSTCGLQGRPWHVSCLEKTLAHVLHLSTASKVYASRQNRKQVARRRANKRRQKRGTEVACSAPRQAGSDSRRYGKRGTKPQTTERNMKENAELMAQLEALRAENAKLKAAKVHKPSIKRSEKGAVSIYGLGRWPVTLYAEQWERLLAMCEDIKAFIEAHRSELSRKSNKTETPEQ